MGLLSFVVAEAVKHLMPFIACHSCPLLSLPLYHSSPITFSICHRVLRLVSVCLGRFPFGSVRCGVVWFGSVRLSSFLVLHLI